MIQCLFIKQKQLCYKSEIQLCSQFYTPNNNLNLRPKDHICIHWKQHRNPETHRRSCNHVSRLLITTKTNSPIHNTNSSIIQKAHILNHQDTICAVQTNTLVQYLQTKQISGHEQRYSSLNSSEFVHFYKLANLYEFLQSELQKKVRLS